MTDAERAWELADRLLQFNRWTLDEAAALVLAEMHAMRWRTLKESKAARLASAREQGGAERDPNFYITQAQAAEWHTVLVEEEKENLNLRHRAALATPAEGTTREGCRGCRFLHDNDRPCYKCARAAPPNPKDFKDYWEALAHEATGGKE
jgi:hypothetical protein